MQPNQFPGAIQDTLFKNPEDFYATSHKITPEIIVILLTRGLPYVQCTLGHAKIALLIIKCAGSIN